MRVMLDTNVLIDYFAKREPYYQDAFKLRVMQEFGDAELWVSVQSFSDIAYVLRGDTDSKKLQQAFLSSLSFLHVCSLDQEDLKNACQAAWDDLEDCLIEQCAKKLKAEYILTRDASGFARSSAIVLRPSEFFDHISSHYGLFYDAIGY